MKKVLAIALPILLIAAGMFVLYKFVLLDIMDPPPLKVMEQTLEAAQEFVDNHTETNEASFVENFSNRSREGLQREWRALSLDGSRRGSWYEMATGILNADGSLPEVLSETIGGGDEEEDRGKSDTGQPHGRRPRGGMVREPGRDGGASFQDTDPRRCRARARHQSSCTSCDMVWCASPKSIRVFS